MSMQSISGDLITLKNGGLILAEVMVTNRGLPDTAAVRALLEAVRAWQARSAQLHPGLSVQDRFESAWAAPVLPTTSHSGPPRAVLPVHVLVERLENNEVRFDEDLWDLIVRNATSGAGTLLPEAYTGGVVRGADFVGRDDIIHSILKQAHKGGNLLLTAPRRFGKTSLMRALQASSQSGSAVLFVDVEDALGLGDLIASLDIGLDRLNMARADVSPAELDVLDRLTAIQRDLKAAARGLVQRVTNWSGQALILVDEVTYMLENAGEGAADCLSLLEELAEASEHVAWLFAASTDFKSYLRVHGLSFAPSRMNDITLSPFTDQAARTLIRALLAPLGLRLSRSAEDRVLEHAHPPVPFFLQILVFELQAAWRRGARVLDEAFIDEVVEKHVLGPDCRRWFDAFRWHLGSYYSDELPAARLILGQLARHGSRDKSQLASLLEAHAVSVNNLDDLLQRLHYDMYVAPTPDGSAFHIENRLLAAYWRRHQAR
jgi:uncharacterized protein